MLMTELNYGRQRIRDHRVKMILNYLNLKIGKKILDSLHCMTVECSVSDDISLNFHSIYTKITVTKYGTIMIDFYRDAVLGYSDTSVDLESSIVVGAYKSLDKIRAAIDQRILPELYEIREDYLREIRVQERCRFAQINRMFPLPMFCQKTEKPSGEYEPFRSITLDSSLSWYTNSELDSLGPQRE